MFSCPVCGAIHRLDNQPAILHCENCGYIFVVENNKANPLNSDDTDHLGPAASKFKSQKGIPIPLQNGCNANFRIGNRFFHIPDGLSLQSLIYAAILNGANPSKLDLTTLLDQVLYESDCSVYVQKLKALVGQADWAQVKKMGNFED